jgi:hypothetical protein
VADVNPGDRYAARDLVAAAAAEDLAASERLVRRWVQLGLLDRPVVRGLGRGRGVVATWPESQKNLFVVLARYRDGGVPIDRLCRIPVWLWLRWGDEHVPLRQVRRALQTWVESTSTPTWSASETAAKGVVSQLAAPGTRRSVRKRLQHAIASQAFGGFDQASLREAAQDSIDGTPPKPRGPEGARLDASQYAGLVGVRVAAIARLGATTEEEFLRARSIYRATKASYERERPRLALDTELGHLFERPTDDDEMNSACLDLITVLGIVQGKPTGETPWNA